MTLHLAPGLDLPDDFVTQSAAILARRGAGKTYTASVLTEELIGAGLPVVALDPLGVWFGLRSSADGTKAGLPMTILGGEHGDVPLEPTGGRVIAELVTDEPGGYIIDLSLFESQAAQDRFAYDFAERLYRAKRRDSAPLHLMVDEAHNFVPQNVRSGRGDGGIGPKLLGAFEVLIRQGRARGLGCTLISQRPAVVNKNVLSQAEVLIAGQVTGVKDRDALTDWAEGWASKEQLADFKGSLASLKVGEVWVWSPQWLGRFERVKIRKRRTFDSSATPKVGEVRVEPRVLASVDLEVVKERLAATIEKADATDPKKLSARIRELERELRAQAESNATEHIERIVETVEVPVVDTELLTLLVNVIDQAGAIVPELHDRLDRLTTQARPIVEQLQEQLARAKSPVPRTDSPARASGPRPAERQVSPPQMRGQNLSPDAVSITGGARRMLEALATYPNGLTESQTATLAKLSKKGGTFSTYLSRLRTAGLATKTGNMLQITDAGLDHVGGARPPVDPDELRAHWRSTLTGGARRMYDLLIDAYPAGLNRDDLANYSGITQTGGTFGTYLSRLRSNGLLEELDDQLLRAHPDLFPEGR